MNSNKTEYGIPETGIKETCSRDHEKIEAWESDAGALGSRNTCTFIRPRGGLMLSKFHVNINILNKFGTEL